MGWPLYEPFQPEGLSRGWVNPPSSMALRQTSVGSVFTGTLRVSGG
ncbi:hypothetical protein KEJ19_06360 [Candidatus Bathyarchaeota archaeon]|nr:hypothetical protein [Candidatus Bathyarchaeota archaeon]